MEEKKIKVQITDPNNPEYSDYYIMSEAGFNAIKWFLNEYCINYNIEKITDNYYIAVDI